MPAPSSRHTARFDAPSNLVFRAFTEADLIAEWLGPRDLAIEVEHFDARTGGSYAYLHRAEDGAEFRFRGVFHTVTAPDLSIGTFEYLGEPGSVSLETRTFTAHGDSTIATLYTTFPSVIARDGAVAHGMEHGIRDSMDRLAELFAQQQL